MAMYEQYEAFDDLEGKVSGMEEKSTHRLWVIVDEHSLG